MQPRAESQAEKTRKLIAVLQSNAPLFDKARACQQLGEFGNREAVPALAALLADEHLSAYARSGLEGIPDPSAAEALRTAAATLKGNRLAGVVNSLGVLRDAASRRAAEGTGGRPWLPARPRKPCWPWAALRPRKPSRSSGRSWPKAPRRGAPTPPRPASWPPKSRWPMANRPPP